MISFHDRNLLMGYMAWLRRHGHVKEISRENDEKLVDEYLQSRDEGESRC